MIFVDMRGTRVPALGFGTYLLQGSDCVEGVRDALEVGYRHIDTAQGYDNEREVGRALADAGVPREELFVTTKLTPGNFTRDRVLESTAESLARLGLSYVDLLLMHWPNPDVPLEETLAAMMTLRDEGRVRFVGVSNFPPSLFARALEVAPVACNQVEYHPFLSQERLIAMCREAGAMLTAYSPVARGRVTDDPVLQEIAERHGKGAGQVALRWLVQQPNVAAIPKASSERHRRGNFGIFDFELSDDEMQRIGALARGERLVDPDWGPDWEQ